MIKFIKAAQKPQTHMIKVDIDGQEIWAECSPAVKKFCSSSFKEGDEVEFEYDKDVVDGKNKYKINGYVKKVGGGNNSDSSTPSYSGYASVDRNTTIRSQAVGKMVAQSLVALQGHVDPNNVTELIDVLYKKFDSIIK